MKRPFVILFLFSTIFATMPVMANDETVELDKWRLHPAYANVNSIAASNDEIYALSEGALFSVNKQDETIEYYSKLDGLSSADIQLIAFNKITNKLVLVYRNGMVDLVKGRQITSLSDLYLKRETSEIAFNSITLYEQYGYLATTTGIIVVDLKKDEIKDTYYIGDNASDVSVRAIAFCKDSIFAVSDSLLYKGAVKDNLIDYRNWKTTLLPQKENVQSLAVLNYPYLLQNNTLYRYDAGVWTEVTDAKYRWMRTNGNQILAETTSNMLVAIQADESVKNLTDEFRAYDAIYDNGQYWLAAGGVGLMRYTSDGFQQFLPNGPLCNLPYRLQFFGETLMMTQGGRWASAFRRAGHVMWYDNVNKWQAITQDRIAAKITNWVTDIMNYAVDPKNSNHFFATSNGSGLVEFLNGEAIKLYTEKNSTLRSDLENDDTPYYLRTDGALYDAEGNLWVLNTGSRGYPINILSPDGVWHGLPLRSGGQYITITTPTPLIVDKKYPNSKWFLDCRNTQGVILIDDNGTPFVSSDDHVMKRSTFVDQNGTSFSPEKYFTLAQDKDGVLWVGTQAGLFLIETAEGFLESNACKRVIISREDEETQLADYLLADEQINCIVVDGGNRKWIGTAASGLFLMSADGLETIHHFTVDNSPLPSDEVLSIAIHPTTGEVFIGTASGLASYRGDASEPEENFDEVYAYPNPAPRDYAGSFTIARLMDNSIVNIIDAAGNLVCKTRSNGGIAVWDGKNLNGERVASGIYTVLCNGEDGAHAVTKIFILTR